MDVTFVPHFGNKEIGEDTITEIGEEFTIEIGFFDTILDIKEKIEKYRDIPVQSQTLFIDTNNILIDEKGTNDYEIHHQSRLNLYIKLVMDVTFVPHFANREIGEEFTIEIRYLDTVLDIKKKIELHRGIPVESQILFIDMNNKLVDGKCTKDYGIHHQSSLNLYVNSLTGRRELWRKVTVEMTVTEKGSKKKKAKIDPKDIISFKIFLSRTIAQVKQTVRGLLPDDISTNQFELCFRGRPMKDDRLFGDYSRVDPSKITLVPIEGSSSQSSQVE